MAKSSEEIKQEEEARKKARESGKTTKLDDEDTLEEASDLDDDMEKNVGESRE